MKSIAKDQSFMTDLPGFLERLRQTWDENYGGFIYTGRRLILHTGGWSENEYAYRQLERNHLFMGLYWQKSERGGHYYFKFFKFHKRGTTK